MNRNLSAALIFGIVILGAWLWLGRGNPSTDQWTEDQWQHIYSLWINNLGDPAPDPSNAWADSSEAANLGQLLFFDTRLSANGQVSCASCHQPEQRFTDGLSRGVAIGISARHTPSIVGMAWSPWQYWDGRRDSLWAQALSPLEDPDEHAMARTDLVRFLYQDPLYAKAYVSVFGNFPDLADEGRFQPGASPLGGENSQAAWNSMAPEDRQAINRVFANMGKSIAAYERLLHPAPARFDLFVEALRENRPDAREILNDRERKGLALFIGKARCIECHNGPLLTNHEFHNTGQLSGPGELPDYGRFQGLGQVRADPFNCLGLFSDANPEECVELRYAREGLELLGAMKTPSLRNIAGTAPYSHKGQLPNLRAVLEHYNRAEDAMVGHNEIKPLGLSGLELDQLEAFLGTLEAPVTTDLQLFQANN